MATVVRGTVQGTDCPQSVRCRMLMNFQNQSIPSFCSTHLRVQADGYTVQRNSIKYVAKNVARIVIQVYFVENFTTKINCLVKSVYWAYNQVTFCTACVWKHGGTHSIVIVSD